jgi:alpha-L-fucosidase
VLGQSDEVVEYRPEVTPKTTWKQDEAGLHITAYRAQRLYTDRRWPNPLVLKITNVEPGLTPPEVITSSAEWNSARATLRGRLVAMGNVPKVEVGFQYREKKGGTDLSERTEPWTDLPATDRTSPGDFSFVLSGLVPDRPYEFRARVKHPLITMFGEEKNFRTSR